MSRVIIIILISCFFGFSCTTTNSSSVKKNWKREDLVGITIELIDSKKIEKYSFSSDSVSMTFGRKGGFVTGPLAEWKLIDSKLEIGFFGQEGVIDSKKGFSFSLISWEGSLLTLQNREGVEKKFKILKLN